ncbi:MAG: type IV pilus assembly protein [Planctomycetota bacterium]|nr:MAG: type IV pilus assembly protein [Planctomycetota bacterium]
MAGEDLQRVGEILIEEGSVLAEDVARAGDERKGSPILAALVGAGAPARGELARFLAATYQIPHVSIASLNIAGDVIACVSKDLAEKHEIVPVEKAAGIVFIAKANFFNRAAVVDVRRSTGLKVKVVVAPEAEIQAALKKYYGISTGAGVEVAAPVGEVPQDLVRSTGNTKRYTAPPGRTAALAPTDRISLLFTEDWAPSRKNGQSHTTPMKALPITPEDYQVAERALRIDHIRSWERQYTGSDPIPAMRMSK